MKHPVERDPWSLYVWLICLAAVVVVVGMGAIR